MEKSFTSCIYLKKLCHLVVKDMFFLVSFREIYKGNVSSRIIKSVLYNIEGCHCKAFAYCRLTIKLSTNFVLHKCPLFGKY